MVSGFTVRDLPCAKAAFRNRHPIFQYKVSFKHDMCKPLVPSYAWQNSLILSIWNRFSGRLNLRNQALAGNWPNTL